MSSGQVWVTSAIVDEDVSHALTLYYSLQKVCTTRRVALIVSPKLSFSLRNAVTTTFDLVCHLEEDRNSASLELHDFAMLYSLSALHTFDSIVYLNPRMMAIKNFDFIFEGLDGFKMLENSSETSIIAMKPSVFDFHSIMETYSKSNETNVGTFLNEWIKDQYKTHEFLKLSQFGNVLTEPLLVNFDVPVINLKNFLSPLDIISNQNSGILGKTLANYWDMILLEHVLPTIGSKLPKISGHLTQLNLQKSHSEPIAIVGMSCRYPASNNLEEFWNLLFEGDDGTCIPPEFRWQREQCFRQAAGSRNTNAGFLKTPVDEFDGKFFGISPKEIMFMDPQHRLLHEVVWESLEDACINPHILRGTSGSVFIGSWINNYKDILVNSGNSEFYRVYMGNSIGACAARISFLLGVTGPSVSTESGCSSAMVAVHLACKSLQMGETNLALACGVNLLLHPFDKNDLPMVISPDGHSKTFSDDADGFARAEGAGVLVLKRLSDAVKDNDNIWGVIRGSAISQEGLSKSMGTPTVHCETLAMTNALIDAKVAPEEVSYIEAHGTGTVVGDPMEVVAIAKAYNTPNRKEPLIIGSVKTNVGHTESCSGITGMMKVVLAMHHEIIPAHRNFHKLNPAIDLDAVPAILPLDRMEWKKCSNKSRVAGVSSFGITGTDAHVIIEEPPRGKCISSVLAIDKHVMPDRQFHILKLSAKTEDALKSLLQTYAETMPAPMESISDICFSANTGRANFPYRASLTLQNKAELATKIQNGSYWKGCCDVDPPPNKICFLFPGQGTQYSGMAKQMYDTSPVFRMNFDYCDRFLQKHYNINITEVLWSNSTDINTTLYSQISIFCVEYVLFKLWESWGVKPEYVLGHSLGEFAAAVCAGVLSLKAGLKLVAERSLLIESLPHGKMLVIKADKAKCEKLKKIFLEESPNKILDYAAFNSNDQTVVAGDSDVIDEFSTYLQNNGIKNVLLSSKHAFHSRHMEPILSKYKAITENILSENAKQAENACEYISGMEGESIEVNKVCSTDYWVNHALKPVNFLRASQTAVKLGCVIFIEIGPQPVLSALTMGNNDGSLFCFPSLKKSEEDWETLLCTLSQLYVKGVEIDWNGLDHFRNRKKVRLPNYPFSRKKYWPIVTHQLENLIHPLLGSAISNPSSTKLFKHEIRVDTLEWIKDHVVGNHIVFSGAGFLEMIVAAGMAVSYGLTDNQLKFRTVEVQNMYIKAPLAIQELKAVQLQTVVNYISDDQDQYENLRIKIFQNQDVSSEGNWLPHIEANFVPNPSKKIQNYLSNESLDINEIIQTWNTDDEYVHIFYEKCASFGLHFGPSFQSIKQLWTLDNLLLAKIKLPKLENDCVNQYIIHPIILDAMIQATILHKLSDCSKLKLHVPVRIGKFRILSPCKSDMDLFVYVKNLEKFGCTSNGISVSQSSALLLDKTGNRIAIMSDIELIQTTARSVDSALTEQTSPFPEMWEEIWRKQEGMCAKLADLMLFPQTTVDDNLTLDKCAEITPQALNFNDLEKLVYFEMLKAICDCGWRPISTADSKFNENDLFAQLNIQEQYRKQFGYFLRVFEEENIIQRHNAQSFSITDKLPTYDEIEKNIKQISTHYKMEQYHTTKLINKVSQYLVEILKGTKSVLGILFPENSNETSVADMYLEYYKLLGFEAMVMKINSNWFTSYKTKNVENNQTCRILEIGAGTGAFTTLLLQVLEDCGIQFEYFYTDISSAFFDLAGKKFQKWGNSIKFKKLNIEEDPLEQGFIPGYYDYVCASDVIHATKNLKETLSYVRSLMRPDGFFDLCEQFQVNRFITFIFGLLDGFWRFEDFDVRPYHCVATKETWANVLNETGFEICGVHSSGTGLQGFIKSRKNSQVSTTYTLSSNKTTKTWVVMHEPENAVSEYLLSTMTNLVNFRRIVVVTRGNKNVEKLATNEFSLRPDNEQDYKTLLNILLNEGAQLEGFLYCWSMAHTDNSDAGILKPYMLLAKSVCLLNQGIPLRFCAIVNKTATVVSNDLCSFSGNTLVGFSKSLQNEHPEIKCKVIDVNMSGINDNILLQAFYEIWNNQSENVVAIEGLSRYVPKLHSVKPVYNQLELPHGSDRFQLILPETKSISDLKFGYLDKYDLEDNEIEIEVKVSALNFRDVLNVLKPSEYFKNSSAIGFDYAGVVKRRGSKVATWSVGDRVFGLNKAYSALPSHVAAFEDEVLKIPDNLTWCEASTLPAVAITSYYCLIDVAKITCNDVVLIHAASGGVGLSAIEICKNVGATVIATAGSKRKQNFLRNLGVQHVFHSRSTQYLEDVMKVTKGRGVDVVLNSLTSEGFKEATLEACATHARFVEMSTISIWTPEEIGNLRPDVTYTTVDLTKFINPQWLRLLRKLDELLKNNIIHPIPYTRFDALDIRQALTYLQKTKHVGKIVCVMPNIKANCGKRELYTPIFHDNVTYLITGGLGGIGVEICKWMLQMGARYVLLAGRSPPNPTKKKYIAELNSKYGACVSDIILDVANKSMCQELIFTKIPEKKYPQLKGIMHAAGTLNDKMLEKHTWESFSSNFPAKILGTFNLHELTKNIIGLEHFVLFSSCASFLGSPGQTNHAAANCYEDAIAHYRYSQGLPATSINWGQWGEVGVATEIILHGIKPLSTRQGKLALEYAMKTQRTQIAVINFESIATVGKIAPTFTAYLDERVWKSAIGSNKLSASTGLSSDGFWKVYDAEETLEGKTKILKNNLENILRGVLKLENTDEIDDSANFQEMGVDSLMFVEIKNALQNLLGNRFIVSANVLKDCSTLSMLASTLTNMIQGINLAEEEDGINEEGLRDLIMEDCILPDDIKPILKQERINVADISTVLLTGVTGTLGPFVLREVCSMKQIKQVICLIRPTLKASAKERLETTLQNRELFDSVNISKVRCISGNISKTNLGLEETIWSELSNVVDGIFHCAVKVQHGELYKKRELKEDTRTVNVQGLKNVLKFACTGNKLKHVYYASSLVASTGLNESGNLSEDWPEINDYKSLAGMAYPTSKFVGDLLMKTAILERRIPGKVFRFPLMGGDSKSGNFVLDQNHLMMRYLYILKTGYMPTNPVPLTVLPVDYCANVTVKLFFNSNVPDDVYNIYNKDASLDQEFVKVAEKLGYKIDMMEFSEFAKRVKESTTDDNPFAIFKDFYKNDEDLMSSYNTAPALKQWLLEGSSSGEFFISMKIKKYFPEFYEDKESSMDVIYRDLLFAKLKGWLDKSTA